MLKLVTITSVSTKIKFEYKSKMKSFAFISFILKSIKRFKMCNVRTLKDYQKYKKI